MRESLRALRIRGSRTNLVVPQGDRGVTKRAGSRMAQESPVPVVIRLSQRLSHACLRITLNTGSLRTAQYTRDNFLGRKVGASQTRITKVTLWLMHASERARKGRPIPLVIWWPLPGVLVRRIPARLGQDTWSSGACAFPGDEDESGKV
jgi:hypothetical protein